jgi:copper(I)-binding protein
MRLPWPAVVGGSLVLVLGAAGLIRGAMPQSAAGGVGPSAGAVTVTGAYVRAPVPPTQTAAAYFTVYNTTAHDDRLLRVVTGAGSTAVLHSDVGGRMVVSGTGAVIPAHGSLVLSTGKGHVMIEHLFGTLTAGQDVNIELDFQTAGSIDVVAPVLAVGAPAPTGSANPADSTTSAHSGAHS